MASGHSIQKRVILTLISIIRIVPSREEAGTLIIFFIAGYPGLEKEYRLLNLIAMPLGVVKSVCYCPLAVDQKLTFGQCAHFLQPHAATRALLSETLQTKRV